MSLKLFHIVFVTASVLLAFGFGGWCFYRYFGHGASAGELWLGIGAAIAGVVLVIYGNYVFKKLKKIG